MHSPVWLALVVIKLLRETSLPISSQGNVGRFNPLNISQTPPLQISSYVCLTKPSQGPAHADTLFNSLRSFLTIFQFYEVGTCQQGKPEHCLHLQTPLNTVPLFSLLVLLVSPPRLGHWAVLLNSLPSFPILPSNKSLNSQTRIQ